MEMPSGHLHNLKRGQILLLNLSLDLNLSHCIVVVVMVMVVLVVVCHDNAILIGVGEQLAVILASERA